MIDTLLIEELYEYPILSNFYKGRRVHHVDDIKNKTLCKQIYSKIK